MLGSFLRRCSLCGLLLGFLTRLALLHGLLHALALRRIRRLLRFGIFGLLLLGFLLLVFLLARFLRRRWLLALLLGLRLALPLLGIVFAVLRLLAGILLFLLALVLRILLLTGFILVLLFLVFVLATRWLALTRGIHDLAILDGVFHLRLLLQCLVVCGDGFVITPLLGQRVALVVPAIRAANAIEGFLRCGEITLAISVCALLYACVFNLVGALPPVFFRRLGRHGQRQGQAHQHGGESTAATESKQGQQHQQRQQPIAFVLPRQSFLATRGTGIGFRRIQHVQGAQVTVIGCKQFMLATTRRAECAQ